MTNWNMPNHHVLLGSVPIWAPPIGIIKKKQADGDPVEEALDAAYVAPQLLDEAERRSSVAVCPRRERWSVSTQPQQREERLRFGSSRSASAA